MQLHALVYVGILSTMYVHDKVIFGLFIFIKHHFWLFILMLKIIIKCKKDSKPNISAV